MRKVKITNVSLLFRIVLICKQKIYFASSVLESTIKLFFLQFLKVKNYSFNFNTVYLNVLSDIYLSNLKTFVYLLNMGIHSVSCRTQNLELNL